MSLLLFTECRRRRTPAAKTVIRTVSETPTSDFARALFDGSVYAVMQSLEGVYLRTSWLAPPQTGYARELFDGSVYGVDQSRGI